MSDGHRDDGEGESRFKTTEDVSSTHSYDLERDDPAIVVVSGPNAGRHIPLEESPTVVGRARGVDVQIEDRGVSSRHLQFVERSSAIWVEDLDSSNGTYVNGERIDESRELLEGDTIGIGRETLICLTVGEQATGESDEQTIRVGQAARWFQVGGADPVDLRRRGALRRILDALVEAAAADAAELDPLDVHELFEVGWPDQQHIDPDAAAQRVYVAIRTLRREGLSGALVTSDDGYYLASDVASIEREPAAPSPPD